MRRDPDTDAPNFWVFARDYLHAYMPRARRLSPRTVQAYRISLECFIGYLTDGQGVDREDVTFDHLERPYLKAWLTWMSEQKGYTPNTIALRLSAIKAFLAYRAAEDITLVALHQGAQALRAPASPRKPIEYLTGDQTRAVLGAFTGKTAKSRRNRMLLILLYETGARVSEITDLALTDLSLEEPAHLRLTGKRNKTRTVPLTEATTAHLGVYLAEFHPDRDRLPASRPVFYSNHRGQPTALSVDTVAAVLKTAASTARATCPTVPAEAPQV